MSGYQRLPTAPVYPPPPFPGPAAPSEPLRSKLRALRLGRTYYVALVLILALSGLGIAYSESYTFSPVSPAPAPAHISPVAAASLGDIYASIPRQGTYYRDPRPGRTAHAFWSLAEKEIAETGTDTCGDKLGRGLVDAYVGKKVTYCGTGAEANDNRTGVTCMPVHHDPFSNWWPYPAAPCVSRNLHPAKVNGQPGFAGRCKLTPEGEELKREMGRERFLGSELEMGEPRCFHAWNRSMLVIRRQDQWNPFHVAEDLITTLVTLFVASTAIPGLEDERLQLVFADDFGMDANHFTPLYDRMGAWAPRRLALDPWAEGECLSTVIHSVGAGASLLSATGVGESNKCASSITWAAAHYYRHLFGMPPSPPSPKRSRVINVLYLSRAKLDRYAQGHGDWSTWRGFRHLKNDGELVARLRSGLRDLCSSGSECEFVDDAQSPEMWGQEATGTRLGFAVIDPTVYTLETQIHYVAHASVLVAQHGGALGLALFLQPARAAVVELQVDAVLGNYHFEHLAYQTGQAYEKLSINTKVKVDEVWESVERHVRRLWEM